MTSQRPVQSCHSTDLLDEASVVRTAIHVISTERAALANLEDIYRTNGVIQQNLALAVTTMLHCIKNGGKLIVSGVGKSATIGKKVVATMISLGIQSAFPHPTEALHGDLGLLRPTDTVLFVSFSGRTTELLLLLPYIPPTVPVIAITSHMDASNCPILSTRPYDKAILLPAPTFESEKTSFGVCAPTTSAVVALSLGDALAIAVARKLHGLQGREPADVFKGNHPGGVNRTPLEALNTDRHFDLDACSLSSVTNGSLDQNICYRC